MYFYTMYLINFSSHCAILIKDIIIYYLGRNPKKYTKPTKCTINDATNGIDDKGSRCAEYAFSKSLFLNVSNIEVSLESSL